MKFSRGFTLISAFSALGKLRPALPDVKVQPLRGFTLIELLVAIAILGILAGIGTIAFSNVQQKGRDAKRKEDLQSVKIALEAYHSDNSVYPLCLLISGTTCTSQDHDPADPATAWIAGLSVNPTPYLRKQPLDPKEGFVYRYEVPATDQKTFVLWAQLENTNDQEAYNPTSGTWGPRAQCTKTPPAAQYNYCVQNP